MNEPSTGVNGTPLSIEFIQEVNVLTGGYLPEFGRTTGDVIDVVTKSGSNEFRGSVFGNFAPGTLTTEGREIRQETGSISAKESSWRTRVRKLWRVPRAGALLGAALCGGVEPQTTISLLDNQGHPHGEAVSVKDMAWSLHERGGFRRCTWRSGTREQLRARFALRRVVAAGVPKGQQEPLWLLIEWRENEPEPANYFLISVPDRTTTKQLIRLVMQRWRTERVHEDLKGELGLDHYEGRRFPGWHHHVPVALCCYAFIIAERVRHFPPRPEGRMKPTRSCSRPERHFHDSFITAVYPSGP